MENNKVNKKQMTEQEILNCFKSWLFIGDIYKQDIFKKLNLHVPKHLESLHFCYKGRFSQCLFHAGHNTFDDTAPETEQELVNASISKVEYTIKRMEGELEGLKLCKTFLEAVKVETNND